jgi:hypothetical protein
VPGVVSLLLTAGYFVRDEANEFDRSPVLLICVSINQRDGAGRSRGIGLGAKKSILKSAPEYIIRNSLFVADAERPSKFRRLRD